MDVPIRPPQHLHHVIVGRGKHLVWCAREDVRPGDERVFYDGDYSDVLEADDPRVSD